jgi:hypothetical protein
MININTKFFLTVLLSAIFYFIFPSISQAANFYFYPTTSSYVLGDSFTVDVYISSPEEAINAASGEISFPLDKVEVKSLSKNGSILNLWIKEPSFSNISGLINFEGIIPNPGFIGNSGKILSINFKAKSTGTSSINFSSGSILANDGNGTDILEAIGVANFSISPVSEKQIQTTQPVKEILTLSPIVITSSTHPDQEKWYKSNNIEFMWDLPEDAVKTRLLIDNHPLSTPTVLYNSAIESKKVNDIDDGIWYLHVQYNNGSEWSEISHFKFKIDTQNPDSLKISNTGDYSDTKAKFLFESSDKTSGIDSYEVKIDNNNLEICKTGIYESALSIIPGKHTIIVKSLDGAGNFLTSSAEFSIEKMVSPIITEYPKELKNKEDLIIKGSIQYQNHELSVWLQKDEDQAKSYIVKSDTNGEFIFTDGDKLGNGTYSAWIEVRDESGNKVSISEKVSIIVNEPSLFVDFSQKQDIIIFIIILGLVVLIFWRKIDNLQKKIDEISRKNEKDIQKILRVIKK